MIKRYIKKPIVFEAIQYDGSNFEELQKFAGNDLYKQDGLIYVHTLNGDMKMKNKIGDYLIKDMHGEFYFCEKKIFEEIYEELDDRKYLCSSTLY